MTSIPDAGRPPDGSPIAARLALARANAAAGLREGVGGIALAEGLTGEIEALVVDLARARFEAAGLGRPSSGLALLATGGFGRGEFAPFSDLDLVFLCADAPGPRAEQVAQSILYPLWDAKLDAGHAVRSVEEAIELPASDLTAATALIDARFLVGDRALADNFLALFASRVAGARPDSFVARLRAEQQTRHPRFGDTIFLLEPDLKNGPGGIRDMCAGRWAAVARFGTGNPRRLQERKEMSARQAAAFEAARDWLLKVRIALHLVSGRRQDQLRFGFQESIGPMLYPDAQVREGEVRPAVAPAVEALMHHFQRHARTISRETERLLQRAAENPHHSPNRVPVARPVGKGHTERVDPSFVLCDGVLEVIDPIIFERQPSEMFRIFSTAIELDRKVGLRTVDLISELAANRAEALRADPDSSLRFLEVLTDVRDQANPSRLEQIQDLGLLVALIPEWEPVQGRVQHDLYHVYTVDQHSLYCVALLKALARGDHVDDHPLPSQEMGSVERPAALYLTALLHDIGKTLGKNHSLKGAELGARIATRLGLDGPDVERLEFLIRHHLVLAHTSQRRDLEDTALIGQVAALCGDVDGLRSLFLLTFSDTFCVGPGNLTSWKEELLRDLFQRTQAYLDQGEDLLLAERAELVKARQEVVAQHFGLSPLHPEMAALLASLPDRYFLENPVRRIAAHLQLVRGRSGSSALEVTHNPRRGHSELVVVAEDVPGLLAKVTGVLFANRIDILDAAIYSREATAPGGKGEALDIFRIRKSPEGAVTDPDRIESIGRDLEAVLGGEITVEALVAKRPVPSSLFDGGKPEVPPTEVKIDNQISADFTVIDVFTEDRPGILYTIARTLHEAGLDIHRSKVGVEADRVADIFYVRDQTTGQKILDEGRLVAITRALTEALPVAARKAG